MRVYLSHKIRGSSGNNATREELNKNCIEVIKIGERLKGDFPHIKFYIPAEHDEFIQIAYKQGYLTESEILATDCKIIDNCDVVLVYVPDGDKLQGGRLTEYNHAKHTKKICEIVKNIHEMYLWIIWVTILEPFLFKTSKIK